MKTDTTVSATRHTAFFLRTIQKNLGINRDAGVFGMNERSSFSRPNGVSNLPAVLNSDRLYINRLLS